MMRRSRYECWIFVFLVFAACADDSKHHSSAFSGVRAGDSSRPCVDQDGDGYGANCIFGNDCDDADSEVTNQCFRCAHINQGCPCEPGQPAISCFLEPIQTTDGRVICNEGTRFCRDGIWSDCESIYTYFAVENAQSTALIDPDAGVPQCNQCNPNCHRVSDPLDSVDGGIGSDTCSNVCWADGGGIRLTSENESDICYEGEPESREPPTCIAADPENGTPGSDPYDDDCDGIPNAYDPAPNQRPLDTIHRAIFAHLGPGDTKSTTLKIPLRTPATDFYLLLDQSRTMSDERDALLATLAMGGACGTDSDCPGYCLQGRCFGTNTACSSDSECSGFCVNDGCRFLSETTLCSDVDADGLSNDELKSQGVLGSIRCMVDQPRFGAGYYNELPLAPYSESYDESVYQHLGDVGEYDDATLINLLNSVDSYPDTRPDFPQAQTQALWSIATAGSLQLGMDRPSVPSPKGCPENGFGYPCFSHDALPVVLMLTDSPFHNGSLDINDYKSSFPITVDPEDLIAGDLVEISTANDSIYDAYDAGFLNGDYLGLTGNTESMTGFLSAEHLGCSQDDGVKDAYFKFSINSEQKLTFSTQNSAFDTTLSLFQELRVDNTNETASEAFDINRQLGADIRGRRIKLIGDTSDMRSDYPGDVVGANTDNQMNDAVFKFSIAEPTTVRIDTEGSEIGMFYALYDSAAFLTSPKVASGGTVPTTAPDEDCDYFEYSQKGYWFCRTNRSFADAFSRCSLGGMSMVRIDDEGENGFVSDHIIDESYLGAHDKDVEGIWQWADNGDQFWNGKAGGTAVEGRYSNWSYLEPNDALGEDCAELRLNGSWNDIPCTNGRYYVCETRALASAIDVTLEPGDYYIVVKGQGTQGGGRYTLTIQDVSAVENSCNNDSGSLQTSEITATLEPGDYLLVLSGNAIGDEGEYQLHVWSQTFIPRSWDRTIAALQNHGIRVMTLLSCNQATQPDGDSSLCDQAFDDAAQLAIATKATTTAGRPLVYRVDDSTHVSTGVVATVQELLKNLTFDVGLSIVPDPDPNPFISTIASVETEDAHDCGGVTEEGFLNCSKTSKPEFALRFTNPQAQDDLSVEARGYAFKIQILGDDDYVIDEVPVYIVAESEPVPQGDPYSDGNYIQDISSSGCEGAMRPDWHTLQWSADVPPGSSVVFEVCTSETKDGLENCAENRAYREVATVTTTDSTEEVLGGDCQDDSDCSPLKNCDQGECVALANCVENRCAYAGQKADVGIALGAENNFRKFLRLKVGLYPDRDTRLTTPTLTGYQLDYVCTNAE